ncbi:TonB-dependent receptor plug domain-containing protein [Blastomonas sp.]|uniref:TonB-dependent receptor plug domain-containing protein n=1 Tax=Blastomonas sp. TaxID=1909299 RepID=UPI00406A5416
MKARYLAAAALAGPAALLTSTAAAETRLPPITVTAPAQAGRVLPPQTAVTQDELVDRQPRSLADVLRGVAGVTVRANSRGETVARIRGAEERQTQVFLDGAPLAVPWDGRVDLGLLPAGLIGDVRITKGAAPIEYGTNTVAGVVDFQTRQSAQGSFAHAEAGSLGSGSGSVVLAERIGAIEATLAAGRITRDAEPLAGPLPFGQTSCSRRTNTDLDAASLFAAIGTQLGDLSLRASLLHLSAERGIAPESDRPPEAGVRYWRYPDIALTQATLNMGVALSDHAELRATAWHQDFGQRIAQYRSASYAALRRTQDDDDATTGGRITLAHRLGPFDLRWAASVQSSTHRQVETDFPSAIAGPRLKYRQNLYSAGVEADTQLGPGIRATLGAAYDAADNPLTGDKPRQPSLGAGAFSSALQFDLGSGALLTVSGGRRTRFPTARELFGEALGRFAINPDLQPERAWLADAELRLSRNGFALTLNPFLIRSEDTLAQRVLADGRRQRFNLSGATSFGIDARLAHDLTERLRLELSGTVLSARADVGSATVRRLPQRPSYEALAVIDWNVPGRFDLRAELRAIGRAIDLDAAGQRVDLPAAADIAVRAAIPVARMGARDLMLTFAVDNLADAQIFPQAGLPSPGRLWRVGLRLD